MILILFIYPGFIARGVDRGGGDASSERQASGTIFGNDRGIAEQRLRTMGGVVGKQRFAQLLQGHSRSRGGEAKEINERGRSGLKRADHRSPSLPRYRFRRGDVFFFFFF